MPKAPLSQRHRHVYVNPHAVAGEQNAANSFPFLTYLLSLSQLLFFILYLVFVTDPILREQESAAELSSSSAPKTALQHYYMLFTQHVGGPPIMWFRLQSDFPACESMNWEIWRLASYALVHANILHVLSNLICQLSIMRALEEFHNTYRVGLLYFSSAIAGALNSAMFDPHRAVVGASGAIYGLKGCVLSNLLLNWRLLPSPKTMALTQVLMLALDVAMYRFFSSQSVSYSCHAGGLSFGLLAGVILLRNPQKTCCEKYCLLPCACGLLFLLLAIWITWFVLHESPTYATIDWPPLGLLFVSRKDFSSGDNSKCCFNVARFGLPPLQLPNVTEYDFTCLSGGALATNPGLIEGGGVLVSAINSTGAWERQLE